MKPSLLDASDVTKIAAMFTLSHKTVKLPFMDRCYDVIVDFLVRTGHEIFTPELRQSETRILNEGLASEYFTQLMNVVDPAPQLPEAEKAILLLLASPEDRAEAVSRVFELTK